MDKSISLNTDPKRAIEWPIGTWKDAHHRDQLYPLLNPLPPGFYLQRLRYENRSTFLSDWIKLMPHKVEYYTAVKDDLLLFTMQWTQGDYESTDFTCVQCKELNWWAEQPSGHWQQNYGYLRGNGQRWERVYKSIVGFICWFKNK